jgi:HlyD family secretion protein
VIVDVELLERPEYWAIGQRAEVYIENGRSDNALTVPLKFCELEGNKANIFVEQSGAAKVQTVDVILRARDQIAVSSGVNEGDVLLRSPDGAKLRDGQKVKLP